MTTVFYVIQPSLEDAVATLPLYVDVDNPKTLTQIEDEWRSMTDAQRENNVIWEFRVRRYS